MSSLMHQGRATYAFFERNWNLTRRYWAWELVWLCYNVVNAVSVSFIGIAAQKFTGGSSLSSAQVQTLTLILVIGTSVWTYLSVTFDGVTDIINMERWEGTIEYTFMAPISRFTHMIGSCVYAVVHGLLFTILQLLMIAFFFHLDLSHTNYLSALFMLLLGSVSFIGFGIMAAILPLLYTEKGMQMSFIVRAVILLVSGVYYPVSVMPMWMQILAAISPGTYVIQGLRYAVINGAPIWSPLIWSNTWPLLITGVVSIPLGVFLFSLAEHYAKRTGRLKRNG